MMPLRNNAGFSLIEIMVTLAISLVMLFLVISIYAGSRESHVENEQISYVLENGRFGLKTLASDLQSIGFLGGIYDTGKIEIDSSSLSLSSGEDCGQSGDTNWAIDIDSHGYIDFLNNGSASDINTAHQCIAASEVKANTDVLVIKRTRGETENGSLTNNTVYLRSNHDSGCLWFYSASTSSPTAAGCPDADYEDWPFLAHVYFIRPYADSAGDGIPTLCRHALANDSGSPSMDNTVCLAEGVEEFNVEFGIDTDSPKDGLANQFIADPTAAQLADAVSAKLYLLVRSEKEVDSTLTGNVSFNLGTQTVSRSDDYYRRVYSTSVMLKNPFNLANF